MQETRDFSYDNALFDCNKEMIYIGCEFLDCHFTGDTSKVEFVNCDFYISKFTGNFNELGFYNCWFRSTRFENSVISSCLFDDCGCASIDFVETVIKDTDFRKFCFRNLFIKQCTTSNVTFPKCAIGDSIIRDSIIRDSVIDGESFMDVDYVWDVYFSGNKLEDGRPNVFAFSGRWKYEDYWMIGILSSSGNIVYFGHRDHRRLVTNKLRLKYDSNLKEEWYCRYIRIINSNFRFNNQYFKAKRNNKIGVKKGKI